MGDSARLRAYVRRKGFAGYHYLLKEVLRAIRDATAAQGSAPMLKADLLEILQAKRVQGLSLRHLQKSCSDLRQAGLVATAKGTVRWLRPAERGDYRNNAKRAVKNMRYIGPDSLPRPKRRRHTLGSAAPSGALPLKPSRGNRARLAPANLQDIDLDHVHQEILSAEAAIALPPADGGRPPVTAAAEYGVDSASPSEMPNKTVSGGEKVPEQVSVGRRADESLQQYFGRVAMEQDARVRTPEGQSRLAEFDAWKRQQRTQQAAAAAAEMARAIREREQLRADASARLEARMLAAGRVRLFVDPGKPWGPAWLASATERVAGLTKQTVPRHLGVGALDYGLDELGRLLAEGRRVENPAGFVVDLAKRVMRRERWRWGTEQDALAQPHLVVPLTPEGKPMAASGVRLVSRTRAATNALAPPSPAASSR